MNRNIGDYVKVYNLIDRHICNKTIEQLNVAPDWKQHEFYYPSTGNLKPSNEQEFDITYFGIENHSILMKVVWDSLNQYIKDLNFPWYNFWNGYSKIKYHRYNKNTLMTEHCDHIHDMFDGTTRGIPVLSVVGILNDDYSGGEFIMFNDTKIELKQGDILIFPSNFLYPHKVMPITEGTRYSFVSWVW